MRMAAAFVPTAFAGLGVAAAIAAKNAAALYEISMKMTAHEAADA
jgi:hypothetical protein